MCAGANMEIDLPEVRIIWKDKQMDVLVEGDRYFVGLDQGDCVLNRIYVEPSSEAIREWLREGMEAHLSEDELYDRLEKETNQNDAPWDVAFKLLRIALEGYAKKRFQEHRMQEAEQECHVFCLDNTGDGMCGIGKSGDCEKQEKDAAFWEPLPLWRVTFDGIGEDTVVLEAKDEDEALDSAKDMFPFEDNVTVTKTDRHFPNDKTQVIFE